MTMRALSIPVILGTCRKSRLSANVARVFVDLLNQRAGVTSELIDVSQLRLPVDDAGEAIKDERFASAMNAADGLVIVAPEYNHSFPGLLKHVLDSCLQEYVHKAVGLVGVSSGPFAGTRVVQSLLPVMRELGLVTIFWDGNIGQVGKMFDDSGRLLDDAIVRRSDKFIRELIWMAKCLRHGREQITVDDEAACVTESMPCPSCGDPMNHHADKALPESSPEGGAMPPTHAILACAACGMTMARPELSVDTI
jgi:NAD(P)H-dependent FMN reductase